MSRPITALAARRIGLAAQGFGRRRPAGAAGPTARQIMALIERLGLLQLDSVNVFLRAHYMPGFSRLGPYDTGGLDRLAGPPPGRLNRQLVEYWAHEASLVPFETHRRLRWRMSELAAAWGSIA